MTFDPKATLEQCDTLMLDMDGTGLDLAYDNYMWLTHVPGRYAEAHGMTLEEARDFLLASAHAISGDLKWYCLDHWSEYLGVDVFQLHRDEHHRIDYLPGAQAFLETVRSKPLRVLLVTNSHPDTLHLKDEVTGLSAYFDGVYTSHSYGFAKESQAFWQALHSETGFDPETTMFVDDSHPVLASAATYGVQHVVAITRPDTSEPQRDSANYLGVEGVSELA